MYQPTPEQLLEAPAKVLYEWHMFFASLNACLKLQEKKELDEGKTWTLEDDGIYNATLEATLLHARITSLSAYEPHCQPLRGSKSTHSGT